MTGSSEDPSGFVGAVLSRRSVIVVTGAGGGRLEALESKLASVRSRARGEPYLAITRGSGLTNPPTSSEIWIAWALAELAKGPSRHGVAYRKVSGGADTVSRNEPEPLTTTLGATYIYYRQHEAGLGSRLRRAETGLPRVPLTRTEPVVADGVR